MRVQQIAQSVEATGCRCEHVLREQANRYSPFPLVFHILPAHTLACIIGDCHFASACSIITLVSALPRFFAILFANLHSEEKPIQIRHDLREA